MKLLFASDLHGSAYYAEKLEELIRNEAPDKTVLLGDLLYHGPRNDLPREYDPKKVTAILNGLKTQVLAVRGNCDAEVDQMVLEFPIMADYMALFLEGRMVFVTHGHLFNEENLPNFNPGDVLIHGHTHVRAAADRGAYFFLNPGSMALPKGDGVHSYMVYEDGVFTTKDMDGAVLETLDIHELGKQLYGKLSPGQKQRLHLALALVGNPDILFLDEPTAGLDVQGRMALRKLMEQLKQQSKTVVLTSHDMGEVENLCDTLAILAKGKVVFAGTPQQLRQQEGRANKVILHTDGEAICFASEDLGRDLLSQLELCRAAGQKVLDIQVERDSLEQCFLRLTKEENK